MKIDIETLRRTKGIGSKTLEGIIEQHNIDNEIKAFESRYIPSDKYKIQDDVTLWQGDCLELMHHIPDKSVDMVLCDLPYGTTACSWDEVIPFEPLWSHYKRIVKDRGAIVLFGSGRFTNTLINSNQDLYRYKWIWKKTRIGNFVNANNRPMTSYEEVLVFSKGITANTSDASKKMLYYPQGLIEINETVKAGESKFGTMHGKRPSHKSKYVKKYTNYPVDVLEFASVNNPIHPTQKPVELGEYLIKTYTNEGMTVMDNTMGVGSFGVSARKTNRKFIGIEMDEKYFNIAKDRIESDFK